MFDKLNIQIDDEDDEDHLVDRVNFIQKVEVFDYEKMMRKRDNKKGLVTLCIGGGMGISMCIARD